MYKNDSDLILYKVLEDNAELKRLYQVNDESDLLISTVIVVP